MKFNVTQKLLQIDGKSPMIDNVGGKAVEATLRMALVNGLLAPPKSQLHGMELVKRNDLAERIYNSDEIDLNEEEIKLLKDVVSNAFQNPRVVSQVYKLLQI